MGAAVARRVGHARRGLAAGGAGRRRPREPVAPRTRRGGLPRRLPAAGRRRRWGEPACGRRLAGAQCRALRRRKPVVLGPHHPRRGGGRACGRHQGRPRGRPATGPSAGTVAGAEAGAGTLSPIVVSADSVGDRVKPAHAALVVVDGLHRALGYWMAGHRRCRAYMPLPPSGPGAGKKRRRGLSAAEATAWPAQPAHAASGREA